jgi:hypothetical protein
LYLAKFAGVGNIDDYFMFYVEELWEIYRKYLKDNKHKDPAFPNMEIKFK